MKKARNTLLTTVALITLQANPGWSVPNIQINKTSNQIEINRLKKNIENNYRDIKSINDLGVIHLKIGQFEKAIVQFKKALEVSPIYTLGPVFSGNIYTDAESHHKKIKELQRIIKENREYARANNYLGLAYLKQKNYATAKHSLLESIKINPKYAKAHNNLGVLYEELGDTAKAIESYKVAHNSDPSDSDSLYNLGLAYDSIGDGDKSVHYMVLAKKTHEKHLGQKGISRFNEKADQLWAKYADNENNDSVASLDSSLTLNAVSPLNARTNKTSLSSSSFTPLNKQTSSHGTNSNISYKTAKALTVNLKPQLDTSEHSIIPVGDVKYEQGQSTDKNRVNDENVTSVEDSKMVATFPEKNHLTAKVKIEESTFTESESKVSKPVFLSESKENVETATSLNSVDKKKVVDPKKTKKTWVSDWVFEYPK